MMHDEIIGLLEVDADTESAYSRKTLSCLGNSSGSFTFLPAEVKIFHGRETEVQDILVMLLDDFARVAILGTAGMGKTSLATAVLHNPRIANKYQNRHFISCDSAVTSSDLISITASNLSLEPTKGLAKVVFHHLFLGPPCLIILDNFETPWEPDEGRADVEEFLSSLTDIPHVALVITMRGAERPGRVKWTRPFIPPLTPLSHIAARQTFIDITDEAHDDSEIDELLSFTDNLPLAVILVANVAGSEGCAATLARWKSESTSLLSDGYDKRSNLEISITLSLSSPRMRSSPHARELLSLLSLLSDGITDEELVRCQVPIRDILKCKTTLIRTTLAYHDHTGRLKVLTPIREYIQSRHPPSPLLVRPLRHHLNGLLKLWKDFMHQPSFVIDLVPRLVANLGNLHRLLLDGLDTDQGDLDATLQSIISLNYLNRVMGRGLTPLMHRIPEFLDQIDNHSIHARYIAETFRAWQFYTIADPNKSIDQAIDHFHKANDFTEEARFYTVIAEYNLDRVGDLNKAQRYFRHALSLATRCRDPVSQIVAVCGLATTEWFLGNYHEGIRIGREAQIMAIANGDRHGEIGGLRTQGMCCTALGDFKRSKQIITEARHVVMKAGLQGGDSDFMLLNASANIHECKTEYAEARRLQEIIVRGTSLTMSPVTYAHGLINIAFLDVFIGASADTVAHNLDAATAAFRAAGYTRGLVACDACNADLMLLRGEMDSARAEYVRLFGALRGNDDEIATYCLAKLADPTLALNVDAETVRWAVVLVAFTMRAASRNSLTAHQALRCLGDVLARDGADDTALSVFEVALEGFTQMDVHRSRAECMQSMGDIYLRGGERVAATKLWTAARPLFERSQQTKAVMGIDERLGVACAEKVLVGPVKETKICIPSHA
ncbi:hypothetical protein C8R43DRAFT_549827 [Mycena crocata]|nr:hypothetical protein C8R43DRAFT_549827 [Mycena crocata]